MAEEKLYRRREYFRHLRGGGRSHSAATANNILEAIAKLSGGGGGDAAEGGGPTRMKILVKKEDLKKVMEAIRDGRGAARRSPPSVAASLEQRLNWMRRRQMLRQMKAGKSRLGSWRPVLQSIPEEELS